MKEPIQREKYLTTLWLGDSSTPSHQRNGPTSSAPQASCRRGKNPVDRLERTWLKKKEKESKQKMLSSDSLNLRYIATPPSQEAES